MVWPGLFNSMILCGLVFELDTALNKAAETFSSDRALCMNSDLSVRAGDSFLNLSYILFVRFGCSSADICDTRACSGYGFVCIATVFGLNLR